MKRVPDPNNPRTGKKRTVESKLKMSIARKAYYKRIGGYPEELKKWQSIEYKKLGVGKWMIGRKMSEETRQKMIANSPRGKKHHAWKEKDFGYGSLHEWVKRYLGTPETCEYCGKSNLIGRQIQWANKSGDYKRELTDWIRLCSKCHSRYDREHGLHRIKARFGTPKSNERMVSP